MNVYYSEVKALATGKFQETKKVSSWHWDNSLHENEREESV